VISALDIFAKYVVRIEPRLTKACTGAREGNITWMASRARAPGDASRYTALEVSGDTEQIVRL
jgi:hypothetical protein